jgi:hypothetical protein
MPPRFSATFDYKGLRSGCTVYGIIEQRGIEIRFTVPWIVETRRTRAINPMVLEDVDQPLSMKIRLKVLIMIEARKPSLACDSNGIIHRAIY